MITTALIALPVSFAAGLFWHGGVFVRGLILGVAIGAFIPWG